MASTPTTLTLSDHFVDHYAALGVDPARMRAVVDDGPAADAVDHAVSYTHLTLPTKA